MKAVKWILVLAILAGVAFIVLGYVNWDRHTGLQHIDNALGSTVLSDTFDSLRGKASTGAREAIRQGGKAVDRAGDAIHDAARDAGKATKETMGGAYDASKKAVGEAYDASKKAAGDTYDAGKKAVRQKVDKSTDELDEADQKHLNDLIDKKAK